MSNENTLLAGILQKDPSDWTVEERRRIGEEYISERKSRERLEEIAYEDDLTGLSNYRRFMSQLEGEIERLERYDAEVDLSVIGIDLDRFKLLNDEFGHAMANRALINIADEMERSTRRYDIHRYGGDEFSVVLPGADEEEAVKVAERLEEDVMDLQMWERFRAEDYGFGLSVGVSEYDEDDYRSEETDLTPEDKAEAFYHLADRAMYTSKEDGEGRIAVARSSEGYGEAFERFKSGEVNQDDIEAYYDTFIA